MKKQTLRVAGANVAVNLGLTVFKFLSGIFGNSSALISEAVHSGADVLSASIAMLGVRLAQNGPDEKHKYGHESFESIASIFLSIILICAGAAIGYNGISDIITGNYGGSPTLLALIAAIISVIVKGVMCHALHLEAKRSGSLALKAEVWHLRTDVLASLGCLLGIIGARFGLYAFDSIAAIIVSLLVLKVGFSIMRDSISKITDQSCDSETISSIEKLIMEESEVLEITELKTRIIGTAICVDAFFSIDGSKSLEEADTIRQQIHTSLKNKFPKITHCMLCPVPVTAVDKDTNRD